MKSRRRIASPCTRHRVLGVSLLELMIALVVAGILAVIAVPSYQEQLRKSRRKDAVAGLNGLGLQLERRFSNTAFNAYPADVAAANTAFGTPRNSEAGFYSLSFDSVNATTYTIRATRRNPGPQANDTRCGDYTLTQDSQRSISGSGSLADCWPTD